MTDLTQSPPRTRTRPVGAARLAVAALVAAAVVATVADVASRTAVNPFNLFGYFTVQSNLVLAVVLVLTGVQALRGRPADDASTLARACATTYIALVGLVYATLLAPLGAAGGVPVPWANTVLHVVTPLYAVADWLLTDRRPLDQRRLPVVLVYPAVWTAVVLVRGATDGWVPYPFLDPAQGYGVVALYVLAILVVVLVVGSLVLRSSRFRVPGAPAR